MQRLFGWTLELVARHSDQLSGGRRFCFSCILTWSNTVNCCPFCRLRFNVIRRKRLDLDALPHSDEEGVVDRYPGQVLEEIPVAERDPVSIIPQPLHHLIQYPNFESPVYNFRGLLFRERSPITATLTLC